MFDDLEVCILYFCLFSSYLAASKLSPRVMRTIVLLLIVTMFSCLFTPLTTLYLHMESVKVLLSNFLKALEFNCGWGSSKQFTKSLTFLVGHKGRAFLFSINGPVNAIPFPFFSVFLALKCSPSLRSCSPDVFAGTG